MRDTRGDYQRAYLEEYEAYRRAGRDEDADVVAAILRDHFGVDVTTATPAPAPETATAEKPPETTAAPKPAARRTRAAAKPKTE